MGITSDQILIWTILITSGLVLFARARLEFERFDQLNPVTSFLIFLTFALQFASLFIFLHPHIKTIKHPGVTWIVAAGLIAIGLLGLILAGCQLAWRETIDSKGLILKQSGLYRISRNPQVLAGFYIQMGFVILWSSWAAILWVVLYLILAWWMVSVEEEYLGRIYGEEYYDYCLRTPRFIGLVNKFDISESDHFPTM